MRTHHHAAFYMALAVGMVIAVALAATTGFWIDAHRPYGSQGILMFLGAAAAIILGVELIAGLVGQWLEDEFRRPRPTR